MRIVALLLIAVVLWGCQDRAVNPSVVDDHQTVEYGKSAITLPGMKTLAVAPGAVCKFTLTITGDGMEPMTFAFPLGGDDTTMMIEKIPAGPMRLFTASLYVPEGGMYEGSAATAITAGEVAYVKLVLRKTGSAQIDVIIESGDDIPATPGCFAIEGAIGDVKFGGLVLKLETLTAAGMHAKIFRGEKEVGYLGGALSQDHIKGRLVIEGITESAMFDGYMSTDHSYLKGQVYSMDDTLNPIGTLYGPGTVCPTEPQEPEYGCFSLEGNIDEVVLNDYALKIIEQTATSLSGYFYLKGEMVGKLYGKLDGGMLTGMLVIPGVIEQVWLDGGVSMSNGIISFIKVMLYADEEQQTVIGPMYGTATDCAVIAPPPETTCFVDTLGGETSCKDSETWVKYADEECRAKGGTVSGYYFIEPCGKDEDSTYSVMCFECCGKQ
ncbi:MAG: hypothetical protein JW863_08645 [Chitinispirillaceae bacterium]|nr:hypothetical protein [Chitinispirillaceae bacterium]